VHSSVAELYFIAARKGRATPPACPSTACNVTQLATANVGYSPEGAVYCWINANMVQLAYWPVSRTGNLCGNLTQVPSNITTPQTASIWGTTVTSPAVLMSFNTLYALDVCGGTTGTPLANYILSQNPEQISSYCTFAGTDSTEHPMKFADFNSPVPASAYKFQPQCTADYPMYVHLVSI
jgi:hypothetical protein